LKPTKGSIQSKLRYPLVLRFGGGTRKSRPRPLDYPKATEKGTVQNLDENHSRSTGGVTSPVNFVPSRPNFSLLPGVRNPACP
jgi:hypothetical protein